MRNKGITIKWIRVQIEGEKTMKTAMRRMPEEHI